MTREELAKLGLTDEQATAVINAHREATKGFIPKSRLDEVIEERNGLKTQIADRDKQIETLKSGAGDNQALKDKIAQLQEQNKTAAKDYEGKMNQLKLDNAVDIALSGAKAKNSKAVRALLDMADAKFGEDGKVSGLEAKIKALQESDPYLFDSNEPAQPQNQKLKGITPTGGGTPQPKSPKDMTYAELCDYMAAGGKVD